MSSLDTWPFVLHVCDGGSGLPDLAWGRERERALHVVCLLWGGGQRRSKLRA